MGLSKKLMIAIIATIAIVATSVAVVYYSNMISSEIASSSTVASMSNIRYTLYIVPVAEHTPFDIYHLALYYCVLNKTHRETPYGMLMLLYKNYFINGSNMYYPDVGLIAKRYFNMSFLKDCLNVSRSPIVLNYTYIEGTGLYASIVNCSNAFFDKCLKNHSRLYCLTECNNIMERELGHNSYIIKAASSKFEWLRANILISGSLVRSLGTPEIVYLYLTRNSKARILVYLGLQVGSSLTPGQLYSSIRSALLRNSVPREFAEMVKQRFLTCLDAVVTGDVSYFKKCMPTTSMTSFKQENNLVYAYEGPYMIGLYGTVDRKVADYIIWIAKMYGFAVTRRSNRLYVVLFVSPTCPYCKTEMLSLIRAGVLPEPRS